MCCLEKEKNKQTWNAVEVAVFQHLKVTTKLTVINIHCVHLNEEEMSLSCSKEYLAWLREFLKLASTILVV